MYCRWLVWDMDVDSVGELGEEIKKKHVLHSYIGVYNPYVGTSASWASDRVGQLAPESDLGVPDLTLHCRLHHHHRHFLHPHHLKFASCSHWNKLNYRGNFLFVDLDGCVWGLSKICLQMSASKNYVFLSSQRRNSNRSWDAVGRHKPNTIPSCSVVELFAASSTVITISSISIITITIVGRRALKHCRVNILCSLRWPMNIKAKTWYVQKEAIKASNFHPNDVVCCICRLGNSVRNGLWAWAIDISTTENCIRQISRRFCSATDQGRNVRCTNWWNLPRLGAICSAVSDKLCHEAQIVENCCDILESGWCMITKHEQQTIANNIILNLYTLERNIWRIKQTLKIKSRKRIYSALWFIRGNNHRWRWSHRRNRGHWCYSRRCSQHVVQDISLACRQGQMEIKKQHCFVQTTTENETCYSHYQRANGRSNFDKKHGCTYPNQFLGNMMWYDVHWNAITKLRAPVPL